jgi:hypothetical protein
MIGFVGLILLLVLVADERPHAAHLARRRRRDATR